MKKFLSLFALTLALVSLSQFGSFAAKKSISNYSYTPKIQLIGMKNELCGTYKKNNNCLDTSDYLTNKILQLISEQLKQLGVKSSFDIKTTEEKLKINRNGNGFKSLSSNVHYTISGMTISANSINKFRFTNKGNNTFVYDFHDVLESAAKLISMSNVDLNIGEITEAIEDSLTFSLSLETLNEEHLNELKNSFDSLSIPIAGIQIHDRDLGLEIGKEYLIQRNTSLGIITAIYDKTN